MNPRRDSGVTDPRAERVRQAELSNARRIQAMTALSTSAAELSLIL